MILKWLIQKGPTIFLRIILALVVIILLAICITALPKAIAQEASKTPEIAWKIYLFLVDAYLMALAFLAAVYQAFKLLHYADGDRIFSESSVLALKRIQYSALCICAGMVAGVAGVLALSYGSGDEPTGPTMLGFLGTVISCVGFAFTAMLQKQVQNVVDARKR